MQTRGIAKTSGLTRATGKTGDLIEFKGFRSGIPREQAHLINLKRQKITRKVDFLSLAFYYSATVCMHSGHGSSLKIKSLWEMRCLNIRDPDAGISLNPKLAMSHTETFCTALFLLL